MTDKLSENRCLDVRMFSRAAATKVQKVCLCVRRSIVCAWDGAEAVTMKSDHVDVDLDDY
jgi:hypothetical protein